MHNEGAKAGDINRKVQKTMAQDRKSPVLQPSSPRKSLQRGSPSIVPFKELH